jgi:hypothetical protein
MKTWSKTILSVYKYLEALSNSIDNLVLKKSINSAFYNNGRYNTCFDCANKIMQLTERKINLINIKVLVDDTLKLMSTSQRQLIAMCYMDNAKSEEIADMMHISIRTFFRKKNDALNSFAKNLLLQGFTKEKLEMMFCGEGWLNNLYLRNQYLEDSKEFKIDQFSKRHLFKSVLREFNVV